MNESDIQEALFREYRGKNYEPIVPNTYLYGWESDLVAISQSGLVNEFEIKLSRSDFKADFCDRRTKVKRHRELEKGEGVNENDFSDFVMCPSYFWFVTPPDLISVGDVPEYAGLMEVEESEVRVVERAPRLHTERLSENQINGLTRGLMLRYWRDRLGVTRV